MTTAYRWRLSTALLLAFVAAACGDGPTAPRVGTLRVSVQSTGGDPDVDGFDIVVDSNARRHLAPNVVLTRNPSTMLSITGSKEFSDALVVALGMARRLRDGHPVHIEDGA